MTKRYDSYLYSDLTEEILRCVHEVHRKLGHGFLEKVYENALMIIFEQAGLRARQQGPVNIIVEGKSIGEYIADILVEDTVVLERKAISELASIHEVQLVNCLRASGHRVGLLINFGSKLTIKRKIC
jgi:GxxExxY protein